MNKLRLNKDQIFKKKRTRRVRRVLFFEKTEAIKAPEDKFILDIDFERLTRF